MSEPNKLWVVKARGVIWAVAGAVLSLTAAANALVLINQWSSPTIALSIAPNDPTALAVSAGQLVLSSGKGDAQQAFSEAGKLARRSLAGQPLNPRALSVLGYVSEANGKSTDARRQIHAALILTRRELLAQLWSIQDRVRNNDVSGALDHYDLAMRAIPEAPNILIPILADALAQADVRRALAPHIRAAPYWLPALITYSATREDPRWIAAAIMQAGGLPRDDVYRKYEGQLVGTLADRRYPKAAKLFYLSLRGSDPSVPSSVHFSESTTDPRFRPISWSPVTTPSVSSLFVNNGDLIALRLRIEPDQAETVLRKLLFLMPGTYTLSVPTPPAANAHDTSFSWSLLCLEGGNAAPIAVVGSGAPTVTFDVPTECTVEQIALSVSREGGAGTSEVLLKGPTLSAR